MRILASMAFLLFGAALAAAQEHKPVMSTLDNGAMVAVIENHQSPVVTLRIYVRTGSMYEGEYLGSGVSHFLEHLVSGGSTSKRTEAESRELLDSIGAQCNAYTSRDHTCYYITTASRFFDVALDLLSDWVMNASITAEEWQREFEVIQREMESRRSDPQVALRELMDRTLFRVFPARHPVIGYRDAFRTLTRDDVYRYYRRTYVPDNLLVVAAGDVDADRTIEKIKAAFAKFERRPIALQALPTEPRQVARRVAVREMPVGQAHLMMAWRTIPLSHPDLYALDLLSFVMTAGESSRLVQRLREEQRLVTSISSWSYTPGYDGGEFGIHATLDSARLSQAQDAILAEVRRVQEELISDEELGRAKRQKISEYVFSHQTVEAQAASLASDILAAHDPRFSRQYLQRIQKTSAAEIREVARRYLGDDKLCVAIVQPPGAAAPTVESAPATAAVGDIQKFKLPNGLRLLVKRNPTPPLVSVQVFFLGGLRAEPQGKNGLALFTARMLTRGTETRSAADIAKAFDSMGGSISGHSGNNASYVSAACLSEDLPRAIEIVADIVRNPAFRPEEIERLRPQLVAAAERQRDEWREALALEFRRNFFKTHPYRNSPLGTSADIKAISRDDIVEFCRRTLCPANAVVAIFGDVKVEEVTALVERHFATWGGSAALNLPTLVPEPPPQEDATIAVKGTQKIGGVFIGYPGMSISDEKDRYAMDVFDALVSGIHLPRGWLHETLRGKGLVYEVHAYNFVGLERGYFGIYAGCEPAKVEEVKKNILEQIARVFRERIPEAELEAARRICLTADVLDRQTSSQQAVRAALDELYGLGYDASRKYAAGIAGVTEDEVRRVARKYLTKYLCVLMTP